MGLFGSDSSSTTRQSYDQTVEAEAGATVARRDLTQTDNSVNDTIGIEGGGTGNIAAKDSLVQITYLDGGALDTAEEIAAEALRGNEITLEGALDLADNTVNTVADEFGTIARDSFLSAENLTGEALDFGRDSLGLLENISGDSISNAQKSLVESLDFAGNNVADSYAFTSGVVSDALNATTNATERTFDGALRSISDVVGEAMNQSKNIVSTASDAFNRASKSAADSSKSESEKVIKYGAIMVGIVAFALVAPKMAGK